jgi:hypothetical protein
MVKPLSNDLRKRANTALDLAKKLRRRAEVLVQPTQNRICRRARQIWLEDGRPSGRDAEFWLRAEQKLFDRNII